MDNKKQLSIKHVLHSFLHTRQVRLSWDVRPWVQTRQLHRQLRGQAQLREAASQQTWHRCGKHRMPWPWWELGIHPMQELRVWSFQPRSGVYCRHMYTIQCTRQCIIIKASSLTQWWRKLRECSPCECILCSCFWKIEKDKYVDENVRGKGKKAKTRGIYIRKLSRSVALVSMICNGTANLVVSQKLAARSDDSFPYLQICKRFIPFGVTVHISLALFLFFLLLPSLLALEYIQQGIALRWLLWFLSLPQQLD